MKILSACLVLAGWLCSLAATPLPQKTREAPLNGTITISGAWALYPMVVKWSEEFRRLHPGVRFDISAGGAGKGIADALAGMVDIGMVSRELHAAELQRGAWHVAVTKDAVVPVVNAGNPLLREIQRRGLKTADFARIWLAEQPPTWNQLLGVQGRTEIHVYTRSDSCGAAETWALFLGRNQEDLEGIGVFGDPGLNDAVRKDALGIGYNNINYAFDAATLKPVAGTAILPIDLDGNGRIDANENFYHDRNAITRAIADNRYPSPPARDLYLVCKGRPTRKPVRAFLQWVLGEGQKHVGEAGYIGLAAAKVAQALAKIGD